MKKAFNVMKPQIAEMFSPMRRMRIQLGGPNTCTLLTLCPGHELVTPNIKSAYLSPLNIVLAGIVPVPVPTPRSFCPAHSYQVCWHHFLGIFPDAMEYPTILSLYHSPNMELGGFAYTKVESLQIS